jgi:hypothetical protein
VRGRRVRLHELLARPGVHVLLDRDAAPLPAGAGGPLLHVHRLAGSPGSGVVAVRPDGYIGYSSGRVGNGLRRWLERAGGTAGVHTPAPPYGEGETQAPSTGGDSSLF